LAPSCLHYTRSCRPSENGTHSPYLHTHGCARPTEQHFQKLCFCAREFSYETVFDPNCTKQIPNTYAIYTHSKTWFSNPKQLNSNNPKMNYFSKVFKMTFFLKNLIFPQTISHPKPLIKTEILVNLSQHKNFINLFKFINMKFILFWPIFTKITETQQLNQTSHLSPSWILNTNIYPTTFIAHISWIQH